MRRHPGGWWLALVFVLLSSQLSVARARGIKHRIKWSRKTPPSTAQVTAARVAEHRPGTFIKQGRKLDIDLGAEGNRYYEANYWQLPDGIHYDGCAQANVTKEAFVASCVNATQAANQAELARGQQDRLQQRVLWRLIRELCSLKHCDSWSDRGGGHQPTAEQPVVFCLLLSAWLVVT